MITEIQEEYTCEMCGETYIKGWSNEEAKAEAEENFPGMDLTDSGLVCNDCYNEYCKKQLEGERLDHGDYLHDCAVEASLEERHPE